LVGSGVRDSRGVNTVQKSQKKKKARFSSHELVETEDAYLGTHTHTHIHTHTHTHTNTHTHTHTCTHTHTHSYKHIHIDEKWDSLRKGDEIGTPF
jgi:hypothetical protein